MISIFLKKILTSDNIQHTNKVILLCEIIKKYKPDRIKEALIIAGYEEVSKLLDNKTRPRISANNEHKQLLNALKDNRFIISYEFNEKSGIYSYTRSTKKETIFHRNFFKKKGLGQYTVRCFKYEYSRSIL